MPRFDDIDHGPREPEIAGTAAPLNEVPTAEPSVLASPSWLERNLPLSLDAYEKAVLERALCETWGDAAEAARLLGIGRSTFYRKAGKHDIHLGRPRPADADTHTGPGRDTDADTHTGPGRDTDAAPERGADASVEAPGVGPSRTLG